MVVLSAAHRSPSVRRFAATFETAAKARTNASISSSLVVISGGSMRNVPVRLSTRNPTSIDRRICINVGEAGTATRRSRVDVRQGCHEGSGPSVRSLAKQVTKLGMADEEIAALLRAAARLRQKKTPSIPVATYQHPEAPEHDVERPRSEAGLVCSVKRNSRV